MNEQQMRRLFEPGQGTKLICNCDPESSMCQVDVRATDPEAAITGMALLAIQLAQELGVPAENVLAATAVRVMNIGQKMAQNKLEE